MLLTGSFALPARSSLRPVSELTEELRKQLAAD